jgi:hypothetical protein
LKRNDLPPANDRNKLFHGLRLLQEMVNEEKQNEIWKNRWAVRIGLVFALLISAALIALLLQI